MSRPTILCHMITSLDGRLLPQRWPVDGETLMALYEGAADRLGADGWIVGRRTMEEYLAVGESTATRPPEHRADRIAEPGGRALAIAIDRQGRLRPETGTVGDDHLVIVLSERVSEPHVAELAARGVSVVFAGPEGDDLGGALARLGAAFGIDRLLLEGGGTLNGAFLEAGLIDETSTLVLPIIDGGSGVPGLYDRNGGVPHRLDLICAEPLEDGTVWLRHRVKGT